MGDQFLGKADLSGLGKAHQTGRDVDGVADDPIFMPGRSSDDPAIDIAVGDTDLDADTLEPQE